MINVEWRMKLALKKSFTRESTIRTLSSDRSVDNLFKELYLPLVFYVHQMVENLEVSKDIVQEIFVKFWWKFRDYESHVFARNYLYRSAHNASIDYIRHEKVEKKRLSAYLYCQKDFVMIDDLLAQHEIRIGIDRVKNSLPKRCLEVFQLSREEGLTYGQIAKKMSISIKTVETQMSKAIRVFRRELNGLY